MDGWMDEHSCFLFVGQGGRRAGRHLRPRKPLRRRRGGGGGRVAHALVASGGRRGKDGRLEQSEEAIDAGVGVGRRRDGGEFRAGRARLVAGREEGLRQRIFARGLSRGQEFRHLRGERSSDHTPAV